VKEFRKSLDKTVGSQIKSFLTLFNRVAVQRMIDFILSPSNRAALAKSNRNLAENILARSPSSLLESVNTDKLRADIWKSVESVSVEELAPTLDLLYDRVGSKPIKDIVDLDEIINTTPAVSTLVEDNIERFLVSEQGQALLRKIKG
jgi:hypothetical protein